MGDSPDGGIVDANVFLRHFMRDNPEQAARSGEFLQQVVLGEIRATVLPTVLLEVVFILTRFYQASRNEVFEALMEIITMNGATIRDQPQLIEAALDYRRRTSISFADAYHCAMARSFHDGAIVSFDRKLGNVPGITRREPGEFASV